MAPQAGYLHPPAAQLLKSLRLEQERSCLLVAWYNQIKGRDMKRLIIAATVAIGLATTGSALAAKCNVKGTWATNIDGSAGPTLTMTTNKMGTAGDNSECNDEEANIHTTLLNATTWNTKITSKKCKVIITSSVTFDGSCKTISGETASGTITIPGVGALPLTVTKQ